MRGLIQMRKFVKKALAVVLATIILLYGLPLGDLTVNSKAATFYHINQKSVFLNQPAGSVTCTLYATAMMIDLLNQSGIMNITVKQS